MPAFARRINTPFPLGTPPLHRPLLALSSLCPLPPLLSRRLLYDGSREQGLLPAFALPPSKLPLLPNTQRGLSRPLEAPCVMVACRAYVILAPVHTNTLLPPPPTHTQVAV